MGAPTLSADGDTIDVMSNPLSGRINRVIDLDAGERPAIIGDQMHWWVMNDAGNAHEQTGTLPLGIEVHASAFAFDLPGPLRYTTFYRYRVLHRGSAQIDSAYVGIWQDADLGNSTDDYAGSDTTLGLIYTYNGRETDERGYGAAPPAVGIDFVSGGVKRSGTSHPLSGAVISFDDSGPLGDPRSGEEYFNYVRSRWRSGQPLTEGGQGNDPGATPARFSFPGDPVVGEFWSETNADGAGDKTPPSDRRVTVGSGPTILQPGDRLDVVVAVVWARGRSNLDSVTELKQADRLVQSFVDSGFRSAVEAIDVPEITTMSSDGAVTLSWSNPDGSNNYNEQYAAVAPWLGVMYSFEGYEVLRFSSDQDSVGSIVATYDIANGIQAVVEPGEDGVDVVVANGTDSGTAYEHRVGGLDNYRSYHFGVRVYAVQDSLSPKVIRSDVARVRVEPAPSLDEADGSAILSAIGIVPNPYMAASNYEQAGGPSEARFVNVPAGSVVTVFTLSGTRVRVLRKEDDRPVMPWDLTNDSGRRLASGMYLVHVSVPDVGQTVIKFALATPAY